MNPLGGKKKKARGSGKVAKGVAQKQPPAGADGEEERAKTPADIARFLRVEEDVVERLAGSGQIPGARIGDDWRFDQETVRIKLLCSGTVIRLKVAHHGKAKGGGV